jgi:protein import protein ZIM17
VLITCPSCRNRHVISDHLNIFGNRSVTVEDLMRERGRLVKRGTLGEDGDIEFWEDGTTTVRQERHETDPAPAPRSEAAADGGTAPGASWSSSGKKLE